MNTKLLGDFDVYINDGNYGGIYPEKDLFLNSGIPFISATDFRGRVFNYEGIKFISEDLHFKILKKGQLKLNDILIVVRGNGIGKVGFFKDNIGECNINAQLAFIRCNPDEIKPLYLYYLLSSDSYLSIIKRFGSGSAQPQLPINRLKLVPIIYQNLSTQQNIASLLSALDSKIELNNRINSELESMAKTLYDYWFVQFEFPNKDGKPYKISGGKMVWSEELKREIPQGWISGNLSELGEIIGGSTPSRDVEENFDVYGTPWITPKDLSLNTGNKFIKKGEVSVSNLGLKSASLKILPKGSILMSSRAPVGYMAIASNDVTTNQGFKSFVPHTSYPTSFIYYTVTNALPEIINNASGSTFKEISGGTLKTIKVCLSDVEVVKLYNYKAESIFKKQSILESENQKLVELRDWLLPMLMNGQVKVN